MATRKFEWKPGWDFVKERRVPPTRCAPAQYRTSTLSQEKGVLGVFCCPKGTRFSPGKQGCVRAGRKARKPILQALRHPTEAFAKDHPRAWKKLVAAGGDSKRKVKERT